MTAALRIFMAPARYIQGPDVLSQLPTLVHQHGSTPVLVLDSGIAAAAQAQLAQGPTPWPAQPAVLVLDGDLTLPRIEPWAVEARQAAPGVDVVVGVGGGRALDAAKAIAVRLGTAFISVPTIASTDAPASRGLVVHGDGPGPDRVEQLPVNPVCVLVDTHWIVRAPRRYLTAGIGDAISKKFEVEACHAAGALNKHGTRASATALALADACYTTLRRHAAGAMRCFDTGVPDEHFEATVEACVLMSALAFENGGLSVAHALATELPTARGAARHLHGEHVGYATLVQLALQGAEPAHLRELMTFYRQVGLPTSLIDLDMIAPTTDDITALARACARSPRSRNTTVMVNEPSVVRAIRDVEAMAA